MSGGAKHKEKYEITAKSRRRHYDGCVCGSRFPCSAMQPDESHPISIFIAGLMFPQWHRNPWSSCSVILATAPYSIPSTRFPPQRGRRTMFKRIVLTGSLALALALVTAAHADTIYSAVLLGSNEVPPTGSPGTGVGVFTLSANLLTIAETFTGLTA